MRARRDDIGRVQQGADHDIIFHAQSRKWTHDLESAGNAATADRIRGQAADWLAGKSDRAFVRSKSTGNHVEKRRLAGSVRPDNCEQFPGRYVEADAIDRDKAVKALAHAVDGKERGHCRRPASPSRRASQGHTPSGRATTTRSRQIPQKTCLAPGRSRPIADIAALSSSARPVSTKAPRIGRNSVPTPPMIGPRIISIEREILNTCSGKRLL